MRISLNLLLCFLLFALLFSSAGFAEVPPSAIPSRTGKWNEITTRHFRILSNISRKRAHAFATNLEQFREFLPRIAPGMMPKHVPPLVIVLAKNSTDYERLAGMDSSKGRFGAVLDHGAGTEYLMVDMSQSDPEKITFERYMFYLVNESYPGAPKWFSEGIGEYFGSFRMRDDSVIVGSIDRAHVRRFSGTGLRDMELFFTARSYEPFEPDQQRVWDFVAQSALFVQFMFNRRELNARMGSLVAELSEGATPKVATQRALGMSFDDLCSEFWGFFKRGKHQVLHIPLGEPLAVGEVHVRRLPRYEALHLLGETVFDADRWRAAAAMELLLEARTDGKSSIDGASEAESVALKSELNRIESSLQLVRGYMFEAGIGEDKNAKQTAQWYRKSAEAGNVWAQTLLGELYAYEDGVEIDYKEARYWFELASEKGNARAQRRLGVLYRLGRGMDPDNAQGAVWYLKAARQGDREAQANLAYLHSEGLGVPQSDQAAFAWYRNAALRGHKRSRNWLGRFFEEGRGVEADPAKAEYWYRISAESGDDQGQYLLGRFLFKSATAPGDKEEAREWLSKAEAQGHKKARELLVSGARHQRE